MHPGNLLLVDDDKGILEAMADYMRSFGHRVETARTANEAISRVRECPFDLILSDVNLPDQDGFTVLESVRKTNPDTPVVLITGYGTIESAVEAIRLGAFDYLSKPLIDEELSLTVERALGQR